MLASTSSGDSSWMSRSAGDLGLAEKRAVVHRDLGVERQHLAALGHQHRVDLDLAGVETLEGAVERRQELRAVLEDLPLEPQPERQAARLEGLHSHRRVHGHGQDLLGRLGRHFLDVHSPGGARDAHRAAGRAVDDEADVELPGDRDPFLDQEPAHEPALGPGLLRHQGGAEDRVRGGPHLRFGPGEAHPAGLSPAAGVDLGLHHHREAEFRGGGNRFVHAVRDLAAWDGDAVLGKEPLRLVLVKVHGGQQPLVKPT